MTEYEIVTSVINLVTSHEGVTNLSLSPDQVAAEVDTLRGRMIDEMDKVSLFRRPYMGFTQTISSLKVEKVAVGSTTTKFVNIPKFMTRRDGSPAYLYVGGKDGKSPYRVIIGSEAFENAKYDQFIETLPVVLYNEGRMEFRNITSNYIMIIGVFNDPSALEELGVWDVEVNEYPMPTGMVDVLLGKTANSYINTLYRVPVQPNTQTDKPQAAPPNARR